MVRVQLVALRNAGAVHSIAEFEVNVFDASQAPVQRVATDDGIVLMVDTSARPVVLRRTYEVDMEVDYANRAPSPDEEAAFDIEYCEVLSAQLFAQLAPDLAHAIEVTPPFVQDLSAVPAPGSVMVP